ncbi:MULTISPECIES: pitrilysin family protein [unclassified Pseudomonas]|uniref:M16 family metallopeptidase n=1 Tax=unclassified Pseudomonas TaxID=196821 RepID=UPI00131DE912|nr:MULTISPECIES: pitrilysin family protein [unclassified Pseudomonas]
MKPLLWLSLCLLAGCQSPTPVGDLARAYPAVDSLRTLKDAPPLGRQLDIQRWHTAEGAQVLFVPAPELPMFDVRLIFAAGSSQDGATPGLAMLTNGLLNEGTPGRDAGAIADGFERLGVDFSNGAYRDQAVIGLRTLADPAHSEPALALLAEVVGRPTFPSEAIQRIRDQLLTLIAASRREPASLAGEALQERLYGNHPYAHSPRGTAAGVAHLDAASLRAFHARAYAAGNAVIALTGDLDRTRAEQIAARLSRALPRGPALPPLPVPAPAAPAVVQLEVPAQQTRLLLGQLGITRRDPDYAALFVGNQILGGGGFGSRLMTELRERRGLTYGVSSGFTPMRQPGPFTIGLQTRAELGDATLALVRNLLRDYLAQGPTQAELDRAKRQIEGSFPLANASNGAIVAQLGNIGFYDLPSSYLDDFLQQVRRLTVDQVHAALRRHLDPEKFIVVSAGPRVAQQPLPPPRPLPNLPPSGVPEH